MKGDDAVREVHGTTAGDSVTIVAVEGEQSICLDLGGYSKVNLYPAKAAYFGRKLLRLARRINDRKMEAPDNVRSIGSNARQPKPASQPSNDSGA